MARELALIIIPALVEIYAFIKAIIFVSWVVFPYFFLIAGLENSEALLHQLVYYGVAGIISQVIAVAVMFIRHVLRLGGTGDTR